MSKYRLVIIDDEWDRRESAYNKVLGRDDVFELIFIHSPQDLASIIDINPDGYVIDVYLTENGWQTTASEVIEKYIVNFPKPVFLVTEHWNKPSVKDEINKLIRNPISVNHFFAWNEFENVNKEVVSDQRSESTRWKVEVELDVWHQRSSFNLEPDESIQILHISDLQFKDPGTSAKAFLVEDAIAHSLKDQRIFPHFLVVTGDIAYSGRAEEYDAALKWFEDDFLPQLWSDNIDDWRERILLVPGNHDVNLRFASCDFYDYRFDHSGADRLKPADKKYSDHNKYSLLPFREFAHRLTPDKNWNSPHLSWLSNKFLNVNLQFVLLNSSYSLNSDNPSSVEIEADVIKSLKKEIYNTKHENDPYKILLAHHGPQSRDTTINAITNWREVENFIESAKIDMFIHGHGHGHETSRMGGTSSRKNIPIVMAPSTHLNGKLRQDDQLRGFNVIELKRKDNKIIKSQVIHFDVKGVESKVADKSDWFKRI